MAVTETTPDKARKPSGPQVFTIYYRLLELAGREAPATRPEASELIAALDAAIAAKNGGGDDCPF